LNERRGHTRVPTGLRGEWLWEDAGDSAPRWAVPVTIADLSMAGACLIALGTGAVAPRAGACARLRVLSERPGGTWLELRATVVRAEGPRAPSTRRLAVRFVNVSVDTRAALANQLLCAQHARARVVVR
jgi:hypothetical protein